MSDQKVGREEEILAAAYFGFNARHLDDVLALMVADVEWPNGMEGGYVYGHEGVRAYWTRQWAMINPHVEPVKMTRDAQGRIVVEVKQVVKDLEGKVLVDKIVLHTFSFRNGLIARMDIG
jgi:hypothetical protein